MSTTNKYLLTAYSIQHEAPFTSSQISSQLEALLSRHRQDLKKSRKKRIAIASAVRRRLGSACIEECLELKKFRYRFAVLCRPERTGLHDERATGLELQVFQVSLDGKGGIQPLPHTDIVVNLHTLKRLVHRAGTTSFEDTCKMLSSALKWTNFFRRGHANIADPIIQTSEGYWGLSMAQPSDTPRIRTFIAKDLLNSGKALSNRAVLNVCADAPAMFRGLSERQTVKTDDLISTMSAALMMRMQGLERELNQELKNFQDPRVQNTVS